MSKAGVGGTSRTSGVDREAEIREAIAAALEAIDGDRTPLDLVGEIPLVEAAAERIVGRRVEAVRAQGLSWEAIAQRLGISRQAAHKRFGKPKKKRGTRLEIRIERDKT